jgi:hypothetical protein
VSGNYEYLIVGRIGPAFVSPKQQECDLREIREMVKERRNDMERENMVEKCVKKIALAMYRDANFSWGKRLRTQCCTRKEKSGVAWLLAGVWKLRGIIKKINKGRSSLC